MMNIYKLIPLFFISFIFSQFVDMQISIEYNKLDQDYHIKKQIIEDLDEDIKKYFLLNKFCQEYDFIELNLKIHLIIESINSDGTISSIKSHLLITNNSDQYYPSTLLRRACVSHRCVPWILRRSRRFAALRAVYLERAVTYYR